MDERIEEELYLAKALKMLKENFQTTANNKKKAQRDLMRGFDSYDESVLNEYNRAINNVDVYDDALETPYFGRIDFIADDERSDEPTKNYIGKVSLWTAELRPIIIDWRSPISSLYYENVLGRTKYKAAEGYISGEVVLKRTYEISNGKLINFYDAGDQFTKELANENSQSSMIPDKFLQAVLAENKGKKLKDIVATIQAEQNGIIRGEILPPLIVQGAAGSGKTTIALHRIAYLLYHHKNILKPENIMILAPNKLFMNYISSVLPDLNVENVIQTTWVDFAKDFTSEKLKINPAISRLSFMLKNLNSFDEFARVSNLKGSLQFKAIIENYIDIIRDNLLPNRDFYWRGKKGVLAFKRNEMVSFLQKSYSVNKRTVKQCVESLTDWLIQRIIESEMSGSSWERFSKNKNTMRENEKIEKKLQGEVREWINSTYLNEVKIFPFSVYYGHLLLSAQLELQIASKGLFNEKEITLIISNSSSAVESKCWDEDDIAAIIYLHMKLFGKQVNEQMPIEKSVGKSILKRKTKNDWSNLKHIIIDEAQDASLFQIAVLQDIIGTDSFSLFGDLRQGVFSYKGITDWDDLSKQVFKGNVNYVTISQSYRTTIEIMDSANRVANWMYFETDVPKSKPILRHGSPVVYDSIVDLKNLSVKIQRAIRTYKERGRESIAVICYDMHDCDELLPLLKDASLLTQDDTNYQGGCVLLPVYLAKGMEFDAVIIADAGKNKYSSTNELDIKMLYVAITRALHELTIYYKDELTELLQ